LVLLLNIEL